MLDVTLMTKHFRAGIKKNTTEKGVRKQQQQNSTTPKAFVHVDCIQGNNLKYV